MDLTKLTSPQKLEMVMEFVQSLWSNTPRAFLAKWFSIPEAEPKLTIQQIIAILQAICAVAGIACPIINSL